MKLLIKDKPTTDWLTSEIWKFTKLTSGFLLAMSLQVSAATESKDSNFFLKLNNTPSTGSTETGTKNETVLSNFQKTIKGTVTGSKGEPLPGVNILLKGTNNVVTTDFDGKFSID